MTDRRAFIRNVAASLASFAFGPTCACFAQQSGLTSFKQTSTKLANGQHEYAVHVGGQRVATFWPLTKVKLLNREVQPDLFKRSLEEVIEVTRAVAVVPGAMTEQQPNGGYIMQGYGLASGTPCGSKKIMDYGIVYSKPPDNLVKVTHAKEIKDWNLFFDDIQKAGGSLCFLPSLYRNGNTKLSNRSVDKVLIVRTTPAGEQVGVVMFNELTPYRDVIKVLRGLDRSGQSETVRIMALDGGPIWGKAAVATDSGQVQVLGTSQPEVITNFLIFQ